MANIRPYPQRNSSDPGLPPPPNEPPASPPQLQTQSGHQLDSLSLAQLRKYVSEFPKNNEAAITNDFVSQHMGPTLSESDLHPGQDSTSRVLQTLNRPDAGDWVLIIDDVDFKIPEVLFNWLQSDPHGSVLLVSRQRSCCQWLQIPVKNVMTVPPTEPRYTIVHELAVDDRTYDELKVKWSGSASELQDTLSMVAVKRGGKYRMKKSYWEELDLENYTYKPVENRRKAVENAERQSNLYMLPCEFVGYSACDQYFHPDAFDQWMQHIIVDHLRNHLPSKSACWFCDEHEFDASRDGDKMTHFRNRLDHIRIHISDEGLGVDDIKPDYAFIAHLNEQGLISQPVFEEAQLWRKDHEFGVTSIYAHDWIPPERQQ